MPKYVAFLRAINVGGHTVKMDHLRDLFEAVGLENVETFIASGNVIFDSKSRNTRSLEQKIEKHLRDALGYEVVTFVRAMADVSAVAEYKAFSEAKLKTEGNTVYVGFLSEEPDKAAKQKLLALSCEADGFHIYGPQVYWLRCAKFSDSEFSGALLEKTLGMRTTLRNSNTVRRIAAKYAPPGAV